MRSLIGRSAVVGLGLGLGLGLGGAMVGCDGSSTEHGRPLADDAASRAEDATTLADARVDRPGVGRKGGGAGREVVDVRVVDEALRACAGAGDGAAALRVRIAAPAGGRTAGLLGAVEDGQRALPERRCAALGLTLWPVAAGDEEEADRLAAVAVRVVHEDLAGDLAGALAAIGTERAVASLMALAGRDEIKVRRRAALALADVGRGSGGGASAAAARAAVEALRASAGEGTPRVVEAALRGLVDAGGREDLQLFRAHLPDADPLVRQRAVEGLATHGDASVSADLARALGDRFGLVAVTAAQGLGAAWARGESAKVSVAALGAYLDGPERAAADAAMTALGRIGDPAALHHVTPFLFDRDGYLRVSAARALAAIGDPAAIPHLDRALDTELVNARVAVLVALGSFGGAAAGLRLKIQRILREDDAPEAVLAAAEAALRAM